MDWSKAKTILIIALIITNLILFGVLIFRDKTVDPTLTDDFIEDVKDMLGKKNIRIESDIPTEKASLNPLIVEYENIYLDSLYKKIFEKEPEDDLKDDTLEKHGIIIRSERNKLFIYEDTNEEVLYDDLNKSKAKEIGKKFLDRLSFNGEDVCLSYIGEYEDGYRIKYAKKYGEHYVENAYMDMVIDKRGVRFFERLWLKVLDEGETVIHISTGPKAILSLLDMDGMDNRTIRDISLCHYFDPDEHEYVEMPKDPRKGKTIPSWRIQFEDGEVFIIDNYR